MKSPNLIARFRAELRKRQFDAARKTLDEVRRQGINPTRIIGLSQELSRAMGSQTAPTA